jgi:hypothetical protein
MIDDLDAQLAQRGPTFEHTPAIATAATGTTGETPRPC